VRAARRDGRAIDARRDRADDTVDASSKRQRDAWRGRIVGRELTAIPPAA
jgi:hypothetical protein